MSGKSWTSAERFDVEEWIAEGRGADWIAQRLGRTETSVRVYLKRNVRCRALRPLSARAAAEIMGVRCSKTVGRWMDAGWLRSRKGQRCGRNRVRVTDRDALLDFVADPCHQHRYDPDRITDAELRAWALETRTARYLTTGEVADCLGVGVGAVHHWIATGILPAVRHGNWRVRESDVSGFVIPSERDRHGRPRRCFTQEEDARLRSMHAAGAGWTAIGRVIGRHPSVVSARWHRIAGRVAEVAA